MEKLLLDNGFRKEAIYLAKLKLGLLNADSIGLKGMISLWTLGNPYSVPGLKPELKISLYVDCDMVLELFNFLKNLLRRSSHLKVFSRGSIEVWGLNFDWSLKMEFILSK